MKNYLNLGGYGQKATIGLTFPTKISIIKEMLLCVCAAEEEELDRRESFMKIEHLGYLREIARCHSITSAAKRLYMGQTTLSAIVKSIEDELGTKIFQRTSSGVTPTVEGVQFLKMADDIVGRYDTMLQTFQANESPEKTIHILSNSSVNSKLSVYMVKAMQQHNASSTVIFHDAARTRLATCILEGIANIGASIFDDVEVEPVRQQCERNGLVMEQLGTDQFYLCVGKDSKFAHRKLVDVSELTEESQAAPKFFSAVPNGTRFSQIFRKIHRAATLTSNELVKQAVVGSDMIAFMTGLNFVDDPYVASGSLKVIPLTGFGEENQVSIYAISRPFSELSNFEKLAMESIREYFSTKRYVAQ